MVSHIKCHSASIRGADEVLSILGVDVNTGLSTIEAERRYQEIGPNEFKADPPDPIWLRYLKQFFEPMIGLLIASALISTFMKEYDSAISISAAVIIVVTVGFVQSYRSEKVIESLKLLMPPKCNCLREGKLQSMVASSLVPGDIVYLSLGDRVPADIRIIEASDLRIDESNLTGETKAVVKYSHRLPSQISGTCLSTLHRSPSFNSSVTPTATDQSPLTTTVVKRTESSNSFHNDGETIISFGASAAASILPPQRIEGAHKLINIGFMGTLVRAGNAVGVVIATGDHSEFGEVFKMMQSEEAPRTPLQKSMDRLGKHLSIMSGLIILCIVLIGLVQGRNFLELVTVSVSLAVAAIPEGLPIVVTVTLAIGQMRMAARNAIIKKLPAVETLGCVNVICADKTGTMTKNEMTVTRLVTGGLERADVTGVGYNPANGDVRLEYDNTPFSALNHANLRRLVEIGALCNNASLKDGVLCGQPTEGALLCVAAKMRIPDPRPNNTRVKEWPFSSEKKFMVVQVDVPQLSSSCSSIYFVKGAPDRILPLCSRYRSANAANASELGPATPLSESQRSAILAEAARMAGTGGLRVLALAEGSSAPIADLVFAGLVGLLDPPRPDVEMAVEACYRSGVRVIMITGDAKETACAIGSRLSLYRKGDVCLSGEEVEAMDLHQLQSQIHCVTVFYRTGPRHKCKIVKALQQRGLIVAMTGDGVNDAIALKSADIGVAMGASGTDVCKEAADVVLLDDAFSSVLAAMEEGKALFANICNFIRFQLSTSIAALSLIVVSTVLSLPNPLNAMQILYINILMDGPPAQSLGVEPPDDDVVNQPPRHVKDAILDRQLIKNVLVSAGMIVSGTLLIFHKEMTADGKVTPRDTTMTFTCFVLFDMFNALSCRSQKKSVFAIGLFSNRVFVIAVSLSLIGQFCVIYFPPLQAVFQTEALYLSDWLLLLAVSSSVFIVSEWRKAARSSIVKLLRMPRHWWLLAKDSLSPLVRGHRGSAAADVSKSIV